MNLTSVTLLTTILSYDIYSNIQRWWDEEISGKRCSKNIIDSITSVAGSVCGTETGLLLGAVLGGPFGAAVGAFAGGIYLSDKSLS